MDKLSKARLVREILEQYFPQVVIPLTHSNHYTLLIAVLLSAQCTDARVNQITPRLFARADSPQKMISLSVLEIEDIIRPCGLAKTKARAIHSLSQDLIEKFDGEVPRLLHELMTLRGVGNKTASVVLCQAFGQFTFPVDTHIHRCAKRWGLSSGKNVETTEKDLKKLFPKKLWPKLHLQMILFARDHCPARGHVLEKCPICRALQK